MVTLGPKIHERIYRYREAVLVATPMDPMADIVSWVRGLRSVQYTAGLLEDVHQLSPSKVSSSAEFISAHAKRATEFLDQAFSGPYELSYLPIYYALLNLSKAMVAAAGRIGDLNRQRRHGASWSGINRNTNDLKNDSIILHAEGTIPLLYQVTTGSLWPTTRKKDRNGNWVATYERELKLSEIYPYIVPIGFEYGQAYGVSDSLRPILVYYEEESASMSRIVVDFVGGIVPTSAERRKFKLLAGFTQKSDIYVMARPKAALGADPIGAFRAALRVYLLYDSPNTVQLPLRVGTFQGTHHSQFAGSITPVSGSNLHLPEELPIILAFFHLSNVVRYAPHRLSMLFDSRAGGMLETLIRQGSYRFLELFWSYMNKRTYLLSR